MWWDRVNIKSVYVGSMVYTYWWVYKCGCSDSWVCLLGFRGVYVFLVMGERGGGDGVKSM